jgi:drug/metabolite transporter (DMT)-like permease
MRHAAPELGALATAEIRLLLAAVVLNGVVLLRFGTFQIELWREFVLVGFFNCALPFALFAYAATHLPSGYLSVLNATSPLFGAVFGVLLLRETLSSRVITGLFFGFVGVALLVAVGPVVVTVETLLCIFAGLTASMSYGFAVTRLAPLLKLAPGLVVASGTVSAAAVMISPALFLFAPSIPNASGKALISVLVLGVLCTAIAYLIYFDLVKRIPPTRAISVTFLIPVFATVWGILFLDERFTVPMGVGAVLALGGTYLVLRRAPASAP